MNTAHLKDIDWKQYLSTQPDGDPTEWLSDIVNAFEKDFIDFMDASITLQRYDAKGNQEYLNKCVSAGLLVDAAEKRKDMQRARIYNERRKFG